MRLTWSTLLILMTFVALAGMAGIAPLDARPHAGAPAATAAPTRSPATLILPSPPPPLTSRQSSKIDELVTRTMADQHLPGLSLAVVRSGGVVYAQGYGYRNAETRSQAQAATLYQTGPITQQFTAVCILLLQQDGRISLDDAVSKYLPDFPRAKQIKVRDLLAHTSGVHDYLKASFDRRFDQAVAPSAIVEALRKLPPDFDPGTRWAYSHADYALLGYIIEQISGLSYRDFLYQRIVKPVGLGSTGYSDLLASSVQFATGYTYQNARLRPALPWDLSWSYAAGGVVSSASDLGLWDGALMEGKVINAASLQQMFSPTVLPDGRPLPHVLGMESGFIDGHREMYANGILPGFSVFNGLFPDSRLAIVLLANRENFDVQALARQVFRLL